MSEMEESLNDTNSLSAKVADHITAMLAYWDKDLVCRFANSAYVDWFGKTKEEMVDKITIPELLGPLYEPNLPYIKRALQGEIQTFEREIPIPSGTTRHSLANYYPEIENGEVLGFFVHVADVSPLKLLEIELQKSNDKIKDQNNRLLNFSNIVSHNLKSYAGNLSTLLNLFRFADSEEEKEVMLGLLEKVSVSFTATVSHLNEVTRSQNMAKAEATEINLFQYVEKTKETLLGQIETTKATISNQVPQDTLLCANIAYIESILLNLLSNAIKYRKEGTPPQIIVSSTKKPHQIIIKIQDNGKGIDLAKHGQELFGMYKTFHGNQDAEGIGLFITKYQVETMGGQIEVESAVNVGTTFTVTLPLIERPPSLNQFQ